MISITLLNAEHVSEYRNARLECLYSFPENFGTTYEEEKVKSELFFEKMLRENNHNNFIFGAFDEQRCVGLCGFVRETRERTVHRGEIVQMYVHADYQGQGIGKKILQMAVDKAFKTKGIEQIILSVVASNGKAITVYEQLGFEHYGTIKNYFKLKGKNLDGKFMIKYKK